VATNDATDYNGNSASKNYTWENGNISTLVEGNHVINYKYYADKKFQVGDWGDIQQFLSGFRIYENKNLVQSAEINGTTTTYAYQFDDEGRIVEAKSTTTIATNTFKVEYECP
jgi:hypothetical protein